MSIRFLVGAGVGFAAGYSIGRVLEARAHGVPLDVAFANLGKSVAELRAELDAAAKAAKAAKDKLFGGLDEPDRRRYLQAA